MEEGAEAPSEYEFPHTGPKHDFAAMEEGAEAPSETKRRLAVHHGARAAMEEGAEAPSEPRTGRSRTPTRPPPQWRRAQKRPRRAQFAGEAALVTNAAMEEGAEAPSEKVAVLDRADVLDAAMEEGAEAPSEGPFEQRPHCGRSCRNGGGRRSALGGFPFVLLTKKMPQPQWRRAQKRPRRTLH